MELKEIVAKNLIGLRKFAGITQLELAEKLNYSDKAVSKWERAESLPDVETIKKIADLYGVSVDCLLKPNTDITKTVNKKGLVGGQKAFIAVISAVLVWVVATFVYAILCWSHVDPLKSTYSFIIAIPLMMIVLLVFNSIWGKVWVSLILVSAIIWTVALCVYFLLDSYKVLCFIVPIPIQIAFIFFYGLKIFSINLRRKTKEKNQSSN